MSLNKIGPGLFNNNADGKVAVPILLYLLGVPGGLVLVLWFFFFRG